ncbi:hypothetical protein EB796_020017 [Bugula neritina]|uniref:Uncharacterized protein n=1 Tax=Bugula neritina TaxID=10212 RepID=A0A7J7J6M3_BUGNE|nr:hypothetical protein EB796_020017 [Bugula neritina]
MDKFLCIFGLLVITLAIASGQRGLQVFSENKDQENAAIKSNEGAKAASGTKLAAKDAVFAETFNQVDALDEGEGYAADDLEAAEAASDLLNAREESQNQQEAFIDTQNQEKFSGQNLNQLQTNDGFFDTGFFGDSLFNTFRKK